MKNFYSLLTLVFLLMGLICNSTANAQETNFFTFQCGSPITVSENCPTFHEFNISVTGQGTMGVNNYGIVEASFEIEGFFGTITLVSPSGDEFILATSVEGINSFPDHDGNDLNVAFRNCESLLYHSEPTGSLPTGGTYRPHENFTALNNGTNSADGTWKLRMCGLPDDFTAFCGSVTFGPICPEVDDFIITPSTCGTADGGIDFSFTEGACSNILVNVNGQPWLSYPSQSIGYFLFPGEYTVCWGEELMTSLLPGVTCEQCSTFVVPSIDNEDPVFTNCQPAFTAGVDANCQVTIVLPDPDVTDNCGPITGTATHVDPDGNTVFSAPLSPGTSFNYTLSILGDHIFTYVAEDENGNSTTCVTTVTVEDNTLPEWTNQIADITGECGVDDLFALAAQAATQLSASDNCGPVTIFQFDDLTQLPPIIDQACGATATYTWRMDAVDESGNLPVQFGLVRVTMEDNLAPVISGIPANTTINCNESFPNMPAVTAIDACEGDISDQVTVLDNEVVGSCNLGGNASVITYTFSVSDGCNNSVSADWTVTVFNSEAVSLGPDFTSCVGTTETLVTSGLSGTYAWSTGATTPTINVNTTGTYAVTVTGISGCCSEDQITVTFEDVPVATAVGGTLDCSGNAVQLSGSSSVAGSSFGWSGPGGFTSTQQNPTVSQAGTYILSVTSPSGACADVTTAEVISNNDVPNISTVGGAIDCNVSSVTLLGNSTTSSVTYAWTGPGGFTSSMQNPTVSVAGTYQLTVTAPNSCIAEGVAVVTEDIEVPTLSLDDEVINCDNPTATLTPVTNDPSATFAWTGPGGFTSSSTAPTVSAGGTYNLTITSANGCQNTASSVVTIDTDIPNLTASGATITCTNPTAQLTAASTTSGVTFVWTGPNGYSATAATPTTTLAGSYTVTVEAPNGCTQSATVTVGQDIAAPSIASGNDELNCTDMSIDLLLTIAGGTNTIAWTGPGGFTSTMQNPSVSTPGTYNVTVTGSNGCTSTATAVITQDIAVPNATATGGSITCTANSVQITGSSTTAGVSFLWSGPNAFTSTIPAPTVGSPGTYTLTVTANNGCTATASALVEADGDLPNISATGGQISCTNTSVTLTGSSTTAGVTYLWTGPQMFSSTMQNPTVSAPGIYTLTVTAENGCVSSTQVNINNNTAAPMVNSVGGTITCEVNTVTLTTTGSTGSTYAWSGPSGFTSTMQSPTVSAPGQYIVTATGTNGCIAMDSSSVDQNADLPQAAATGGTISCTATSVMLAGSSTTAGVTFSWSGPNGFTSTLPNPVVTVAGTYTLTVSSGNGCSSTATAMVTGNTEVPNLSVNGGALNCSVTTIVLNTTSTTAGVTYSWTGPAGFTSNMQSPIVSEPGNYVVTATAPNGCSSTSQVNVTQDIQQPPVIALGGTLSCEVPTITLSSSSSNGVTFLWSGPGGFTSTMQNPIVSTAGTYTLTVTATNGCTNTATAEVQQDANLPVATLEAEEVDCEAGSVTLQVVSDETLTYSWTFDGTVIATGESVEVSDAGLYTVQITSDNGCVIDLAYTLATDIGGLTADITTTDATSSNDGTATISINSSGAVMILWDNGQTGTTATGLTVGDHTVTVTDLVGCTYTFDFTINMSTSTVDIEGLTHFAVYPTIISEQVTVEAHLSKSTAARMTLYSTTGELVINKMITSTSVINETINTSLLSPGIYVLALQVDGKIKTEKLMKY